MKWQFELSDCPINPAYPIKATQLYDNGVQKGPFHLTMEDFINSLKVEPDGLHNAEKLVEEETNVSPTFPVGTIRYSSDPWHTRQRITMEIPQKQWDIKYGDDDEFFSIGFPRMVIQYLISSQNDQKKMIETRLFAVLNDKKPIDDETPLFHFPYPNVGKSNGIVCWGRNQRLEITRLTELERAFQWFIASPFNEDHGVRTTHGIANFRKLIDRIQDKPFDDEWLIPIRNQSFRELYV